MPVRYIPQSYFICPACGFQHRIYRDIPILCCGTVTHFSDVYPMEGHRVYLPHPSAGITPEQWLSPPEPREPAGDEAAVPPAEPVLSPPADPAEG